MVRAQSRYLAPLGLDSQVDLKTHAAHVGHGNFGVFTGTRVADVTPAVETTVWHRFLAFDPTAGSTRFTLPEGPDGGLAHKGTAWMTW